MKRHAKALLLTALIAGTTDLAAAYINQFIKTGKFADKMFWESFPFSVAFPNMGTNRAGRSPYLIGQTEHFFFRKIFSFMENIHCQFKSLAVND